MAQADRHERLGRESSFRQNLIGSWRDIMGLLQSMLVLERDKSFSRNEIPFGHAASSRPAFLTAAYSWEKACK